MCGSPLHSMHGRRRPLLLQQRRRQGAGVAHAGKDVDIADRAVASLPYLVPLLDGLRYGACTFIPTRTAPCSSTMQLSVWQHDVARVAHYVMDCLDVLGCPF